MLCIRRQVYLEPYNRDRLNDVMCEWFLLKQFVLPAGETVASGDISPWKCHVTGFIKTTDKILHVEYYEWSFFLIYNNDIMVQYLRWMWYENDFEVPKASTEALMQLKKLM